MFQKIRELPPVCLLLALVCLLLGKLRLLQEYRGLSLKASDGSVFRIFRNIVSVPLKPGPDPCVFVVSFKFSSLSHRANKLASLIPMLLIAGFPGFRQKMYSVNAENGYWQGIYQWRNEEYLDRYRQSFVFRMMNKRAIPDSVHSMILPGQELMTYVDKHVCHNQLIND